MNANVIPTLLDDLLAAIQDAYDQTPDSPDIPETRYVTFGPAVYATDQITVAWSSVYPSSPNSFPQASLSPSRNAVIPVVELVIECARQNAPQAQPGVNRVKLPEPEQRAAAAELLARDATTLFGYLSALAAQGTMFRSCPVICKGDIALGRLTPIGPSGTYSAFRWPIQVKAAVVL